MVIDPVAFARWQGHVEADLDEAKRRMDKLDRAITSIDGSMRRQEAKLDAMTTASITQEAVTEAVQRAANRSWSTRERILAATVTSMGTLATAVIAGAALHLF